LLLKCHVCLSFVIKMRKLTKLKQKLQISHFDVIRALRYWRPVTHITMHTDTMVQFLPSSFADGMSFSLLNHMVLPFK